MNGGEVLAFLGENAMALQVAVEAEITKNIEGVVDVLERSAELVAAVAPFAEVFRENLPPRYGAHLGCDLQELFERVTRVGIQNRRDNCFFCGAVVFDERDRLFCIERPDMGCFRCQRLGSG